MEARGKLYTKQNVMSALRQIGGQWKLDAGLSLLGVMYLAQTAGLAQDWRFRTRSLHKTLNPQPKPHTLHCKAN